MRLSAVPDLLTTILHLQRLMIFPWCVPFSFLLLLTRPTGPQNAVTAAKLFVSQKKAILDGSGEGEVLPSSQGNADIPKQ